MTLTTTAFAVEWTVNPLLMRAFPDALPNEVALAGSSVVWLVTLLYSLVCVALGGYVAARLAPRWPVRHAIGLGVAQAGLTAMAAAAMPELASWWQWTMNAVLAVPAAVVGGRLYDTRVPPVAP